MIQTNTFQHISNLAALILLSLTTACSQSNPAPSSTLNDISLDYSKQDQALFGPKLSYAVTSNNLSLTEQLLLSGSNVNAPNPVGETPLIIAINNGNNTMLRLLLKYGAQPNNMEIGKDNCNRLLDAASSGDTRFYILPLDIARKKGKQSLVELLIHYGAKSATDCFKQVNEEQRIWEQQSNQYDY